MIFGVSGQDGSYLAEFLLVKGYKVIGVKRRSSAGSLWRLSQCLSNKNFKLVEGDITDYSSILHLLSDHQPGEIYNLAAQSNVGTSFNQPGYTWDVTAKGVMNLLEAMRFLRSTAKLYQASSSEMFGDSYSTSISITGKHYEDGEKFQDEITDFTPQSPYAIAKLAAHQSINLYRKAYGLWCCGGILFNHESPRRGSGFVTRKITKWFNDFVQWRNQEFKTLGRICLPNDVIYYGLPCRSGPEYFPKLKLGNLDACRDWGFAGDYVEAMWLMLQQSEPKDYVIGTGETHTVKEFLQEVMNFHKIDVPIEEFVNIDESCKRPAEVPYLRADASLSQREFGWKSKMKFTELVQHMCEMENGLE